MKNGDRFPPITVFKCKEGRRVFYTLADGFHRCLAAELNKQKTISCEIWEGETRDALEYALKANSAHGLRRTNKDKRNAVKIALKDKEWSEYSNHEIARLCAVSEFLVRSIRKESSSTIKSQIKRKVKRGGKTYVQEIGKIGKKTPRKEELPLLKVLDSFLPKTLILKIKEHSLKNEIEVETLVKKALRSFFENQS